MIHSWVTSTLKSEGFPEATGEALKKYVWEKLSYVVNYAFENSNFYKERFTDTGLPMKGIGAASFQKLPFTCADDIIEKPYWFLCVSQSEVLRSYVVDTADEKMKQIFFTQSELEHIVAAISSVFRSIGVSQGTNVAIVFPHEYEWGIPDLLTRASNNCGGITTLVEEPDLEKEISQIRSLKPELIVGSAQQLFFMSALLDASSLGYSPKSIVPCHGCVPYLFSDKARQLVKATWQAELYEHFGITEMGFNVAVGCGEEGWLHLNEVDTYAEIVDPDSGEVVENGKKGELILTSLSSRSMPIIRYRTGYLAEIIDPPCTCNDNLTRRLRIHSTLDVESEQPMQPLILRPF